MKTRTHLRARALYLLLILCISLPQSAWGQVANEKNLNIYANLLCYTRDNVDEQKVTYSFAANADQAKGVWVYVDLDKDGVCESGEEVYSNANTIVDRDPIISVTANKNQYLSLPGGRYKWAVKVQGDNTQTRKFNTYNTYQSGNANTDYNDIRPACAIPYAYGDHRYRFHLLKGLVVNTYHDSPYLGFSYIGEAGNLSGLATPAATTNITSYRTKSKQGIYIFRPNLGMLWYGYKAGEPDDYGAFTGGIKWETFDKSMHKYFGPNRVSTDKDGYVYVCENRPTKESKDRIWRVHHDQMTTTTSPNFTCIIDTLDLQSKGLEKRVLAMSVGYINNEKMLYVITGYTTDAQIRVDEGYCHLSCWKIIETGNGNCELEYKSQMSLTSIIQGSTTHKLISPVCSVVPGNDNGDLWIFQRTDAYEGIDASGQFSALHLSKDADSYSWSADYHIPSTGNNSHQNSSGTGAISTHHVLGDDPNDYYLAMPCRAGKEASDPNKFVVKIFRMHIDADGNIEQRERWWNLYREYDSNNNPKTGWGRPDNTSGSRDDGIDGIAFDAANNLFFGASSRTHMVVYALPKENWHMTYGPTMLHIPYKVESWNPILVDKTDEMKTYMFDTVPLPVLSKEGYIFHGWYDDNADSITRVQRDDIKLYAKWTEIKINEGTEVDNDTILTLVDGKTVGMKVNRKMPGGSFSTLCLPFAINADSLANVTWDDGSAGSPLAGATLWTFSGVETNEEANTKTLTFTKTDEVPANTPFLIWPQNDVAKDIFFHNVTVVKADNLKNAGEVTHDGITFHGFINPVLLRASPNNFFLVANNRLATSYSKSWLPALRGYFTAQEGAKLQIRTQQGTPSLLDDVNSNIKNTYKIQKDGKIYIVRDHIVYDLQGNRVAEF